MSQSVASYSSYASEQDEDGNEIDEHEIEAMRNSYLNTLDSNQSRTAPVSPIRARRRPASIRLSEADLMGRQPPRVSVDERTGLLAVDEDRRRSYSAVSNSGPGTPRIPLPRSHSYANSVRGVRSRNISRRGSAAGRFARALGNELGPTNSHDLASMKSSQFLNDRVWYDQFTSTDWVQDSIADAYRAKELRSRKDWRGRLYLLFDGAQGWILVAIIGGITAALAYVITTLERSVFDYKTGYCSTWWTSGKKHCCSGADTCEAWQSWSAMLDRDGGGAQLADFVVFVAWSVLLAVLSCLVCLQTKTTISSAISLSTLDENLGAVPAAKHTTEESKQNQGHLSSFERAMKSPPMTYYPAAGSGVAEVKVILSGFVLHGYLGFKTLACKAIGIVLSVGSGLSVGKEGPLVHMATCIGNIACRLFSKYNDNDGKRREVLSASAAAGVAVAFGAPIGGVLFSLEEVSYYFPPKTLFRTFFCCIAAALSLRFFDPYGTGKIVLFEVRYLIDWKVFEIVAFMVVGILGGALGALFIKASSFWARKFRRIPMIKRNPVFEVAIVALVTGLVSFWNRYTRMPVAELLYELAAPCDTFLGSGTGLCPTEERIPDVIEYLCVAFVIKAVLTTITFGIKVPAGIYIPSMVVGGLLGRIVGHLVQWLTLNFPDSALFASCPAPGNPESCVVPGVYALVAAGATMCGVTRLSVTLAVILFELTGSLEHVLPFSLGVLIAKWTADAIEPLSIYDLLTDMNNYPYLDSKVRPIFTTNLGDITPRPNPRRLIDITLSAFVPASVLRRKLEYLHFAGELDGGLPIVRDGVLVGLIPAPDLEYALDRLPENEEENSLCAMSPQQRYENPHPPNSGASISPTDDNGGSDLETSGEILARPTARPAAAVTADEEANAGNADLDSARDTTDFTPFIDTSPVALDISSPMDLVFECFVKLGLRYICVLKDGRYAGLVHKKGFVKFVKEEERKGR